MFQKMLQGGSGSGEIPSKFIKADTTQQIGSFTSYNSQYTVTEDCVMLGRIGSSTTYAAYVSTEKENELKSVIYGTGVVLGLGEPIGIFIPKGTTLYSRERSDGTYNLKFYKVLKE